MRVLFVHQNFPGQYKHLAPAVAARPGTEAIALSINEGSVLPGVRTVRYTPRRGTTRDIHPFASDFETKVIRGEACAQAALRLKAEGFYPDVICAHPGWGEALFLKDVFAGARLLSFIEFFYHPRGADVGFDPEYAETAPERGWAVRTKNANVLLNLDATDWCVSPTAWQRQTVSEVYRNKISVIHDGINTDAVRPNPEISIELKEPGVRLRHGDDVVTFVNRNLEPYRGFHSFMRAIPEIQRRRPEARILIVGGEDVSYGARPKDGKSYKQRYLEEMAGRIDFARVHFLGNIPYPAFLALLQLSAAHVYLTYPFVLSWSMLEAMSAGCCVIGSRTPPVEEVLVDGKNGLLVDFFSPDEIASAVVRVLADPTRMAAQRNAARETAVARYDLKRICLPAHLRLIDAVAAGAIPEDLGGPADLPPLPARI